MDPKDVAQGDADRRLIEMLNEGQEPNWQRQEWEFDSQRLQARPAGGRPAPVAAPRSMTAGNAAASHSAAATGKVGIEGSSIAKPAGAGQNVSPLPGDAILFTDDELSAIQKQELQGKCHVAGCSRPLFDLREFHQRFQICDEHIKAPRVIRGGRVERFCQQCSRFHAVSEFEGDRRSCRTQLERHNARRRKQRALAAGNSTPASSSSTAAAVAAGANVAEEPPLQRQRVAAPAPTAAAKAGAAAATSAAQYGLQYHMPQGMPGAAGAGGVPADQILANPATAAAAAATGGVAMDPGWPFTSLCIGGDPQWGVHGVAGDNMHVNVANQFPADPTWPWGAPVVSSAPLVPSAEWETPQSVVMPAASHIRMQGDLLGAGEQEAFAEPAVMHEKNAWAGAPEDDFWRVMYDFTHSQTPRSGVESAVSGAPDTGTRASKSHSTQQGGFTGTGGAIDATGTQHMPLPGSVQAAAGERSAADVKSEGGGGCCGSAAGRTSQLPQDTAARRSQTQSPHEGIAWAAGEQSMHSDALSGGAQDGAHLQHYAAVGQASETRPESNEEQPRGKMQVESFRLGPVQEETEQDTEKLLHHIFTKPKVARALRRVLLGTPPVDQAQGGLGTLPAGGVTKGCAAATGEGPERARQRAVIAAAMLQLQGADVPPGARASLRICAKLWACTPDTLPANLQDSVLSWVNACKPEVWGCIRPGCVFLTLDLTVRYDERQAALARGALSLMQHLLKWCSCWREQSVLLQIEDSLAIYKPGEDPVALDPLKSKLWAKRPTVTSVDTRVLLTDGETPVRVTVHGSDLPSRDRPPTIAHACTCKSTRAKKASASAPTADPMPSACVTAMEASMAVQKSVEVDAPLPNPDSLGAENGGANGASLSMPPVHESVDALVTASPIPTQVVPKVDCDDISSQKIGGDIIARCQGDDQMFLRSYRKEDTPTGAVEVEVKPLSLAPGASSIIWIEAWSGMFVSTAVPVLVTTDVELACAVQKLVEGFHNAQATNEKAVEHCKACVEGLMLSLCSS